jgi:hypothetical protein
VEAEGLVTRIDTTPKQGDATFVIAPTMNQILQELLFDAKGLNFAGRISSFWPDHSFFRVVLWSLCDLGVRGLENVSSLSKTGLDSYLYPERCTV